MHESPTYREKEEKGGQTPRYCANERGSHKHTRTSIQKKLIFVKKYKKSYRKLLTKTERSDNICKHSARGTREKLRDNSKGVRKERLEKNLKKFEKSLDKKKSVWYTLWAVWKTAAIGPWKLNNEIRKGTRDSIVQDTIKRRVLKVLFKQ